MLKMYAFNENMNSFRPPDRRKCPCGIRGMSLKTHIDNVYITGVDEWLVFVPPTEGSTLVVFGE